VPTLFSKPASPTCGWMKGTCIHVQDHVNALLTFVESIQSGPKVIQNLYTIYKLRLGYVTLWGYKRNYLYKRMKISSWYCKNKVLHCVMLLALCHKIYMSMAPMTFLIDIDLNYFIKHDRAFYSVDIIGYAWYGSRLWEGSWWRSYRS
jgi:hypothetical protein